MEYNPLIPTFEKAHAQRSEAEKLKPKYSALIKHYHARLVEEGRPENYVLSISDFAAALGITSTNVAHNLKKVYGIESTKEVLEGLGLPYDSKNEFPFSKEQIISWVDDFILKHKKAPTVGSDVTNAVKLGELPEPEICKRKLKLSILNTIKERYAFWDIRDFKK